MPVQAEDAAQSVAGADSPVAREEAAEQPEHRADHRAFRRRATLSKLRDAFAVKLEPAEGDALIDLLPAGSVAVPIVNPGFDYTYANGKPAPKESLVFKVKAQQTVRIKRGGEHRETCDPIEGWSARGCAGLETTESTQTLADGSTGYALAHGSPHSLKQTLPEALEPNTRYALLVEVFKYLNYEAPKAEDLIVALLDGEGQPIDAVAADYDVIVPNNDAGFAVALITLTTSADQAPGDLVVELGIDVRGKTRVNYDNVRLWRLPAER
ncbi:MAG: hypothetical protein ACPGYV_07695 [Phycisphaeraceae bacterium]